VVVAAALGALAGALAAVVAAWDVTAKAWERRHLDYRLAADYLFGRDYLDALRAVRERVPESGTVYFVDAEPVVGAGPYFALHYLAPRRLVKLGSTRQRSLGWLRGRAPDDVEVILFVEGGGAPPRLVDASTLPIKRSSRAR
jgi:hypothetical protein